MFISEPCSISYNSQRSFTSEEIIFIDQPNEADHIKLHHKNYYDRIECSNMYLTLNSRGKFHYVHADFNFDKKCRWSLSTIMLEGRCLTRDYEYYPFRDLFEFLSKKLAEAQQKEKEHILALDNANKKSDQLLAILNGP